MAKDRLVIVSAVNPSFSHEMKFDSKKMKDSEALHFLLCEFDPGDTYSVSFKNIEAKEKKCSHLGRTEMGSVGYFKNTEDCGFGCKILYCDVCDRHFESHLRSYGCPFGGQVIPVY